MSLIYKFNREQMHDGSYLIRPKILVTLKGSKNSFPFLVLLDSGSDVSVIPESVADLLGLDKSGNADEFIAYNEKTPCVHSKCNMMFRGKQQRLDVSIDVPILIAMNDKSDDIVLGVQGIFDHFKIIFNKSQNHILLKEQSTTLN